MSGSEHRVIASADALRNRRAFVVGRPIVEATDGRLYVADPESRALSASAEISAAEWEEHVDGGLFLALDVALPAEHGKVLAFFSETLWSELRATVLGLPDPRLTLGSGVRVLYESRGALRNLRMRAARALIDDLGAIVQNGARRALSLAERERGETLVSWALDLAPDPSMEANEAAVLRVILRERSKAQGAKIEGAWNAGCAVTGLERDDFARDVDEVRARNGTPARSRSVEVRESVHDYFGPKRAA
ncbi:MAG: hypothetical protein R3A52_24790 [Polyangiales bacterium]